MTTSKALDPIPQFPSRFTQRGTAFLFFLQEPLKFLYDSQGLFGKYYEINQGPRKHLKVGGIYVSYTPFTRNRRSKTIPIVLVWIGLASTRDQQYPYTFGSAIRTHSGPLTKEDPYGSEHDPMYSGESDLKGYRYEMRLNCFGIEVVII